MGKPLKPKKKRKLIRISEKDTEGESLLPAMSTKQLAEQHDKSINKGHYARKNNALDELGDNEQGKEAFDFVLKAMSSPDNQQS